MFKLHRRLSGLCAALLAFVLASPALALPLFLQRLTMPPPKIDYKALDFVCSREEDHVQAPSPEAEAVYAQALALYRQSMGGEEPNEAQFKEAIVLYKKAASLGHWKAYYKLAHLSSTGVKHGMRELYKPSQNYAFDLTQSLIKLNSGAGHNLMAAFLNDGWGVKQDPEAALKYMRKAADLGNVDAQRQLGKQFLNGFRDLSIEERKPLWLIGKKMLACAVRQGDREAAFELATEFKVVDKNYPYALFYYQQAGKLGDGSALMNLQKWFEEGKFGYAKDAQRAKSYEYYRKQTRRIGGDGPFPQLDQELPLPPPPAGGSYPSAEWAWPNAWTPGYKPPEAQSGQ